MDPLFEENNEYDDWIVEMQLGIDEIRMLYSHVCYAIQTWPGSPARPPEEQEYLLVFKTRLFAMMTEYAYEQDSYEKD